MWTATPELTAALLRNHAMTTTVRTVDVDDVERVLVSRANVPVVSGTVNGSIGRTVTRTANLQVERTTAVDAFDVLTTRWVYISTGVAGFGEVPIFTGRVLTTTDSGVSKSTVYAADVGDDIIGAQFETPWQTTVGGLVSAEISRLIQDVDATIGVDVSAVPDVVIPLLSWETDRAKALNDLATGINCITICDRVGGVAVVQNPYVTPETQVTSLTLRDGENGVIVNMDRTRSREKIANSVTLIVERTDGATPVRVTVRDDRGNSLTRWGGPFGKRNITVKVQSLPLGLDAITLARRLLAQSLGLVRTATVTMPHYPLIDPLDVIATDYLGEFIVWVVESVRHNLQPKEPTTVSLRELTSVSGI